MTDKVPQEREQMQECFVAFLDVLGVKNLLNDIKKNRMLLDKIINTIKINSKITEANQKQTSMDGDLDIRGFYFSDSFAFIMKKEPQNLPHLFLIIRYLQDRFWEAGFCFRGAITIGKMYFPKKDENILIGKGIVDAYELESHIAIYPRIVIGNELFGYIEKKEIEGYPFLIREKNLRLTNGIKKDKDGVYFLDLLNPKILRKEGEKIEKNDYSFSIIWGENAENNYSFIIEKVKGLIEKGLKAEDPKIKQKYEWLKSYLEKIEQENGNDR